MKFLKYILAISVLTPVCALRVEACGPYYPDSPNTIRIFRCCTPELEEEWREGCRFQDYEKGENCALWQKITSPSIPLKHIEEVIYTARLADLQDVGIGRLADNKFTLWLIKPEHREDFEYVKVAKEIEELRKYMNNPWYYPYDGDEEHARLAELKNSCVTYSGKRHAARYALQLARLNFAAGDFRDCIGLWENSVCKMPRDIVTDMIASYVGGAYSRQGNRKKAIELFTRSQDIGSLISLKAWNDSESNSVYKDSRVRQLEYIFNRFPNSPLLSVKLQQYIREFESYICNRYEEGIDVAFYNELKQFARMAASSTKCNQRGMWHYALGFICFLEGNKELAAIHLQNAENSRNTPFIGESIRAFRFLLDASVANSSFYGSKLLKELKWLDDCMIRDLNLYDNGWQYSNKMNYPFYFWQDVARRVIHGELCPKLIKSGNTTLALQLSNYASNRIYQLEPAIGTEIYESDATDHYDISYIRMTFDEYRKSHTMFNCYDFSNQFFDDLYSLSASQAAGYWERIAKPVNALDKFLNERSYADRDYICDIIGTLYLREMNYPEAVQWLSKVSPGYQACTNLSKEGYFDRDPFRFQCDKKILIADSTDYKFRFAQKMMELENLINSDCEINRKANAKIRYAIGLRNSFGKCWYLTQYGFDLTFVSLSDDDWDLYSSDSRKGFHDNAYAQKAYKRVDKLIAQALSEFTDPALAAQAHLEMMNYATLMEQYPCTKAADAIRGRCDNYHDYALQTR